MASNPANGRTIGRRPQALVDLENTAAYHMVKAWIACDKYNDGCARLVRRAGEDIFGRDEFTAMRGMGKEQDDKEQAAKKQAVRDQAVKDHAAALLADVNECETTRVIDHLE